MQTTPQFEFDVEITNVEISDADYMFEEGSYPSGWVNGSVELRVGEQYLTMEHGVWWSYDSPSVSYFRSQQIDVDDLEIKGGVGPGDGDAINSTGEAAFGLVWWGVRDEIIPMVESALAREVAEAIESPENSAWADEFEGARQCIAEYKKALSE